MDKIAAEHAVEDAEGWKKVSFAAVVAAGGRGLLNRYNGSVTRLLQDTYPEDQLAHENVRSSVPKGHWESKEARRAFFDRVSSAHCVRCPEDWKAVTTQAIVDMGGGPVLERYGGSVFEALSDLYPEQGLEAAQCRPKLPQGYWQSAANRRAFMERVAAAHGVRTAADWKKVGQEQLREAGGGGLLARYGNNVLALLRDVYPDLAAGHLARELRTRAPKGYWGQAENRRKFLEEVAAGLGITTAQEWAAVTAKQLEKRGGGRLLRMFSSPLAAAAAAFPEMDFSGVRPRRTPKDAWTTREERRAFMDRVAAEFGVEAQEDWRKVRAEDVRKMGGASLLSRYPSMFALLEDTYGGDSEGEEARESWHPLLCRATVPRHYWGQEENVREFLERAKEALQISCKEDWYRVSHQQLRSLRGGTMLSRFRLGEALRMAYPEETWDERSLQNSAKKSSQRLLRLVAQRFFPSLEMVEDYRHADLLSNGRSLELDLYMPEIELAIEYNGKHHYEELPFFGPLEVYQRRDEEKRRMCMELGIRLLTVPYWWDNSAKSFAATLNTAFPAAVEEILQREADLGEEERTILAAVREGTVAGVAAEPPSEAAATAPRTQSHGETAEVAGMYMADLVAGQRCAWVAEEQALATPEGRKLPSPADWRSRMRSDVDGRLVQP